MSSGLPAPSRINSGRAHGIWLDGSPSNSSKNEFLEVTFPGRWHNANPTGACFRSEEDCLSSDDCKISATALIITTLRGNCSERNRHGDGGIPTFSRNGKPTAYAFVPFPLTIRRSTPVCERADVTKTGQSSVENFLVQEIKDLLARF